MALVTMFDQERTHFALKKIKVRTVANGCANPKQPATESATPCNNSPNGKRHAYSHFFLQNFAKILPSSSPSLPCASSLNCQKKKDNKPQKCHSLPHLKKFCLHLRNNTAKN